MPDRLLELGWNSDVGFVGGRQLIYYLRKTDDDRVVIGGGDAAALFGSRIGRNLTANRRVLRGAAAGLLEIFPSLAGVRFTHAWGGAIDMTPTFVPFCHTYGRGNVHAALGFSGHGVVASKLVARSLASVVLGSDDAWSRLCVVTNDPRRMPPEPWRWSAMWLTTKASVAHDIAGRSCAHAGPENRTASHPGGPRYARRRRAGAATAETRAKRHLETARAEYRRQAKAEIPVSASLRR